MLQRTKVSCVIVVRQYKALGGTGGIPAAPSTSSPQFISYSSDLSVKSTAVIWVGEMILALKNLKKVC